MSTGTHRRIWPVITVFVLSMGCTVTAGGTNYVDGDARNVWVIHGISPQDENENLLYTFVSDLNKDGCLDVIADSYNSNYFRWYENDCNSSPNFTMHKISKNAGGIVGVEDLNNDGFVDIISYFGAWHENEGNDTLSFIKHDLAMNSIVEVVDLNNDGDFDLITLDGYYENDGSEHPNFLSSGDFLLDYYSHHTSDLDNDGDTDIITSDGWYENDGTATPEFIKHDISIGYRVQIADLDNDGDMDIISCPLKWLENNGNLTFTEWVIADYPSDYRYIELEIEDLNNDGYMDIVILSGGTLLWYENSGDLNPTFTEHLITESCDPMVGWGWILNGGDLDRDGDVDLLCGGLTNIYWIENPGLGPVLHFVDDDAPNDPGPGDPAVSDPLKDGTQAHPFDAIQEAIDTAWDGDTVIVLDGTYTGTGNRDIDFLGKAITVRSIDPNDPNIVAATIIDCDGTKENPHRGFYFHNDEDENSILAGFTITNGYAPKENYGPLNQSVGGGIFCRGSHPTIINCIIKANTAGNYGGGICCWLGSSPKIINCNITDNIGGGIRDYSATIINCTIKRNNPFGISCGNGLLIDSTISDNEGVGIDSSSFVSPTIINCKISGNIGGGIDCFDGGDAQIINCLISGNRTTANGGGINCAGEISHPTISNCTIVGNTADGYGGGIFCGLELDIGPTVTNTVFVGNKKGAIYEGGVHDDPYVNNCLFYENTEGDYYDNETSSMLVGANQINSLDRASANIDADPCFVEPGYWDANGFWIDGDYHLLPTSLCIDAGDPNYVAGPNETDLDGNPRIINGRIDMGAYEYDSTMILALVDIDPGTLNMQSKGKWITAFIQLPEEYNVTDIEPNSVLLESEIKPERFWLTEDNQIAIAKFGREKVQAILDIGEVELTITGRLTNGTPFEATDIIKVTDKAGKKKK